MSKTLAGTRKRISEPHEGIGTIPTSLAALNKRLSQSEPMVPGGKRAVLGEGPIGAELGFVGEQPGDQEDRQGRPFAGPAGLIFDRALDAAGIERCKSYVTNAVKHFKHEERGCGGFTRSRRSAKSSWSSPSATSS